MSALEFVHDWLRHSHNNLIVAYHSCYDLYPRQTEIACYLSQQCAETALKAYLVFMDIDPPKPTTWSNYAICVWNKTLNFPELKRVARV